MPAPRITLPEDILKWYKIVPDNSNSRIAASVAIRHSMQMTESCYHLSEVAAKSSGITASNLRSMSSKGRVTHTDAGNGSVSSLFVLPVCMRGESLGTAEDPAPTFVMDFLSHLDQIAPGARDVSLAENRVVSFSGTTFKQVGEILLLDPDAFVSNIITVIDENSFSPESHLVSRVDFRTISDVLKGLWRDGSAQIKEDLFQEKSWVREGIGKYFEFTSNDSIPPSASGPSRIQIRAEMLIPVVGGKVSITLRSGHSAAVISATVIEIIDSQTVVLLLGHAFSFQGNAPRISQGQGPIGNESDSYLISDQERGTYKLKGAGAALLWRQSHWNGLPLSLEDISLTVDCLSGSVSSASVSDAGVPTVQDELSCTMRYFGMSVPPDSVTVREIFSCSEFVISALVKANPGTSRLHVKSVLSYLLCSTDDSPRGFLTNGDGVMTFIKNDPEHYDHDILDKSWRLLDFPAGFMPLSAYFWIMTASLTYIRSDNLSQISPYAVETQHLPPVYYVPPLGDFGMYLIADMSTIIPDNVSVSIHGTSYLIVDMRAEEEEDYMLDDEIIAAISTQTILLFSHSFISGSVCLSLVLTNTGALHCRFKPLESDHLNVFVPPPSFVISRYSITHFGFMSSVDGRTKTNLHNNHCWRVQSCIKTFIEDSKDKKGKPTTASMSTIVSVNSLYNSARSLIKASEDRARSILGRDVAKVKIDESYMLRHFPLNPPLISEVVGTFKSGVMICPTFDDPEASAFTFTHDNVLYTYRHIIEDACLAVIELQASVLETFIVRTPFCTFLITDVSSLQSTADTKVIVTLSFKYRPSVVTGSARHIRLSSTAYVPISSDVAPPIPIFKSLYSGSFD